MSNYENPYAEPVHDLSELSPPQQVAVAALQSGMTVAEAAQEIGKHRNTIYRWMREDEVFAAVLAQVGRELAQAQYYRLMQLQDHAANCIERSIKTEIDGKNEGRLALQLLKYLDTLETPVLNPRQEVLDPRRFVPSAPDSVWRAFQRGTYHDDWEDDDDGPAGSGSAHHSEPPAAETEMAPSEETGTATATLDPPPSPEDPDDAAMQALADSLAKLLASHVAVVAALATVLQLALMRAFHGVGFHGVGFHGVGFHGVGFHGVGFHGVGRLDVVDRTTCFVGGLTRLADRAAGLFDEIARRLAVSPAPVATPKAALTAKYRGIFAQFCTEVQHSTLRGAKRPAWIG